MSNFSFDDVGLPIALDNGYAQAGETLSPTFVVQHSDGVARNIQVTISTADPYGQVTSATYTAVNVASGTPFTIPSGQLLVRLRQDTPCGHRLPVVIHATVLGSGSPNEDWAVHGILVGTVGTAPLVSQGPMPVPSLHISGETRGAWKETTPQTLGIVEASVTAGEVHFLRHRLDGSLEGNTTIGTGQTPDIARGSDGWGITYQNGGNIYFRKFSDSGSLSAVVTVTSVANAASPFVTYAPGAGWVVAWVQNAATPFAYYARFIKEDLTTPAAAYSLAVAPPLKTNLLGVATGWGDGTYYYYEIYYRSGTNSERLTARRWKFTYAGVGSVDAGYPAFDIENFGGSIKASFLKISRTSSGQYHDLLYNLYSGGADVDSIWVRRFDSYWHQVSARVAVHSHSGEDQPRSDFGFARRSDTDLDVVYACHGGITSARIVQQAVRASTGTLVGSPINLTEPLIYSKLGRFYHYWISPTSTYTFFAGGHTDSGDLDGICFLATQSGDIRTPVAPFAGREVPVTSYGQAEAVEAAAAGNRVGVLSAGYSEGGTFLRILDRDGDPATTPTGVAIPRIAVSTTKGSAVAIASNGRSFLTLWWDGQYRYKLFDASTGTLLAGPTPIPELVAVDMAIRVAAEWTGVRYRFVQAEMIDGGLNFAYYTGTIGADGSYEGNLAYLGTLDQLWADWAPDIACDGNDKCWVKWAQYLGNQTGPAIFEPKLLGATALELASDGANVYALRSDLKVERLWPDGTSRSVGPVLENSPWTSTLQEFLFDGDELVLFRMPTNGSQTLPTVQILDLETLAPSPGWQPFADSPIGSWALGTTSEAANAFCLTASGDAVALWGHDFTGYDQRDIAFARANLPEGYLTNCASVGNAGPTINAGGPYTLYIRKSGSALVLTDGKQTENKATFAISTPVSDPDYGGWVVTAGWDFNADGVIDVETKDLDGNGIISVAESTTSLNSDQLLSYGFPTDTTTCTCPVRFIAIDQLDEPGSAQVGVTMVDQVPPTVQLLVPSGGEAWPGGSTQNISWDASDNVGTASFDLSVVYEDSYPTKTPLPATLTEGNWTYLWFDVPATGCVVKNVTLDLDVRWPGLQPGAFIKLGALSGTYLFQDLQVNSTPLSNFTQIVGNYDRTLATYLPMSVFDGRQCDPAWRLDIYDLSGGGVGTVYGARLNITYERTTIATGIDGSLRSHSWTLPSRISPRTRIEITAKDAGGNSAFDDSTETFFITQPNSDQVRTLVAWNEERMRWKDAGHTVARYQSYQVDALEAKLLDFVGHPKIDGVLLDLSSGEAGLAGVYSAWDGTAWNDTQSTDNPINANAANDVAAAIRTYLFGKVETLYPNLETIILVGGDSVVPFFRESDTTPLNPESGYLNELATADPPSLPAYSVDCNATRSPTWAAVCANDYFSDGRYGASGPKPVPGSALSWWVPDVAVGRLVETPEQIAGLLDTYVAQDGVTIAGQILTTGYDFLTDGGDDCYTRLTTALDPAAHQFRRLSESTSAWTDDDLKNRLFGAGGQVASAFSVVAGHADHRAEGAAGASGSVKYLLSTEMNTGTAAVRGAMVLGLGCHSGLSVMPDGASGDPLNTTNGFQLDLAELFAIKQFPVLIGNSGYGWGLTDGVGLGERLLADVVDEITRAGQISLGEALRLAKQEYFLRQDRLDDYDHKVIHESTLLGIPNYEIRVTKKPCGLASPDGISGTYGIGEGRLDAYDKKKDGPRVPGEPWLGDPGWTVQEDSGRVLRKSAARTAGAADLDGNAAPAGVSLRVMDFSYQAFDWTPPSWLAGHSYTKDTAIRPTAANGHVYRAKVAGTSGSGEPTWPTATDGEVTDGTITWKESSSAWTNAFVRFDVCRNSSNESEPCSGTDGAPGTGQTKVGTYFSLDGLSTGEGGDAIQPMISYDNHLAGTSLHGIVQKGGDFVEPREVNLLDPTNCTDEFGVVHRCFDPVIGSPQTKATYAEGPAPAPFLSHAKPTPFLSHAKPTPHGFVETNGNANSISIRWDNLNAPMGEIVRRGAKGSGSSRKEIYAEWLYRTRDFTQYYSSSDDWDSPVPGAFTGRCGTTPTTWVARNAYALGAVVVPTGGGAHAYEATVAGTSGNTEPVWPTTPGGTVSDGTVTWQEQDLLDCYSSLSGMTVSFDVPVTDEGDGIYKVFLTWSGDVDAGGNGAWQTLELVDSGSGHYTGTLPVRKSIHYSVQAVDWAGNVADASVSGNDMAGNGSPMGSTYDLTRLFSVVLPDADADGIPDAYEALHPCLGHSLTGDPDYDLLTTQTEMDLGLDPCSADTDGGGDNDGSERNHGRSPFGPTDDLDITLVVAGSNPTYSLSWGDGLGRNSEIDGSYWVYRSSTPFFGPAHLVAAHLSDGTKSLADSASCTPVCYYKVWNIPLSAPPPTVAVVVPASGGAGKSVTVFGNDFVSGASVRFGTFDATSVVVVNASQITCTTPTGPPSGPVLVTVTNPSGQDGTLAGGYTY
jgi:hypothetical protein